MLAITKSQVQHKPLLNTDLAIVRIRHRFERRRVEWLAAMQMTLLGLVLLSSGETLESSEVYKPLAQITTDHGIGSFMLIVGIAGLFGLVINGAMQSVTPWIRVARAVVGAMTFSLLGWNFVMATIMFDSPLSTGIAMYIPAAIFEFSAMYLAIQDARIHYNGRRNESTGDR